MDDILFTTYHTEALSCSFFSHLLAAVQYFDVVWPFGAPTAILWGCRQLIAMMISARYMLQCCFVKGFGMFKEYLKATFDDNISVWKFFKQYILLPLLFETSVEGVIMSVTVIVIVCNIILTTTLAFHSGIPSIPQLWSSRQHPLLWCISGLCFQYRYWCSGEQHWCNPLNLGQSKDPSWCFRSSLVAVVWAHHQARAQEFWWPHFFNNEAVCWGQEEWWVVRLSCMLSYCLSIHCLKYYPPGLHVWVSKIGQDTHSGQ